jgi:hypothetical protein
MLWLILAQLMAPTPTNSDRWLTPDDVPLKDLKANSQTVVRMGITVDPDGNVQDCRVEQSNAPTKVDDYTCKLMKRRARFQAAVGADGRPAYGVYRAAIEYWVVGQRPPPGRSTWDLGVSVAKLPSGLKSPVDVKVAFAVDAQGNSSACVRQKEESHPALAKIACAEFLKSAKLSPANDKAGNPVPSVQNATVRFIEKP